MAMCTEVDVSKLKMALSFIKSQLKRKNSEDLDNAILMIEVEASWRQVGSFCYIHDTIYWAEEAKGSRNYKQSCIKHSSHEVD